MSDTHAEKRRGSDTASVALGIRKSCSLGYTFSIFPEVLPFQHAVAPLTIDDETSEWGSKYHTLGWLCSLAYAPLGLLSARASSCVGGYGTSAHI